MSTPHPIRSVLVHLDGTARAEARMRLAAELAQGWDAHLSALFAVVPRYLPFIPLAGGIPSAPARLDIDPEHRQRALDAFRRVADSHPGRSEWLELGGESIARSVALRALTADLLVLGQRDALDAEGFDLPADFVESVVIESGRPTLVVPAQGSASATPGCVLIAWKPTREAARALTAALPFLRAAREVCLTEEDGSQTDAAPVQVRDYLRWHGIPRVNELRRLARHDTGADLLALAGECGAQCIVLGCYGHGRAREWVLGGVSRTVLQESTIPLLTMH